VVSTDNDPSSFGPEAFVLDHAAWVPPPGAPVLVDAVTGSRFNLHGEAYSGPLAEAGIRLPQLYTFSAFWFAWSIFYPGSEIWGRTERVRDADIPSGDGCLVPCGEIYRACFGGRDCIPSLPNTGPPQGALRFTDAGTNEASYLLPQDLVIGVWDGKEARAYPRNILWWHEIANERFGGLDFSVTLCPLTGSVLIFDGSAQGSFGVSGNLYNSNLVMYDHASGTLWPQLRRQGVTGAKMGQMLSRGVPCIETTWESWLQLHPDTRVLSSNTGSGLDYSVYPYGDYRQNDHDTFAATNPAPDPLFPGKAMTFGLVAGGVQRAYVLDEVVAQTGSERGVIKDEIAGMPIAVVFDRTRRMLVFFHRGAPGVTLDLGWGVAP